VDAGGRTGQDMSDAKATPRGTPGGYPGVERRGGGAPSHPNSSSPSTHTPHFPHTSPSAHTLFAHPDNIEVLVYREGSYDVPWAEIKNGVMDLTPQTVARCRLQHWHPQFAELIKHQETSHA
jgi:hypothetical protein